MPEIVCNTSPLLYLHQLGHIDLLHLLYGEVVVPGAVLREIDEGARRSAAVPEPAELPWLKPAAVDDASLLRIVADLGPGEREVLALGLERSGASSSSTMAARAATPRCSACASPGRSGFSSAPSSAA